MLRLALEGALDSNGQVPERMLSSLKQLLEDEAKEVEPDALEDVAIHAGLLLDRRAFPDRLVWPARRNALIPDGVNPVLEKDLRMESPRWSGKMISILIQAGVYLALPVMMVPPFIGGGEGEGYRPILGYGLYLLGFLLLRHSRNAGIQPTAYCRQPRP